MKKLLCLMMALMLCFGAAAGALAAEYDSEYVSLDGTLPILKEGHNVPKMTIAVIRNS